MNEPPPTRASLLVRLRDAEDGEAWRQFVSLYAPLVYSYARRHRLQDADAADLTQDVLRAVNDAVAKFEYDRSRGAFHSWLLTLAHHKVCDFLTRRQRQAQGTGDTTAQEWLQELPAPEEEEWNREYQQRLFAWAAEQAHGEFKEATWQAFWRTAVEGQSAGEVSDSLGISLGAVYIAKSRVQARIKQIVQGVEDEPH
jgi:RNA polymerase sigma-70 factor (ECF subfamily)